MADPEYVRLIRGPKEEWERIVGESDSHSIDLRGADLRRIDLSNRLIRGVDLEGANLKRASLAHSHLSKLSLIRADLRYADLQGAVLDRCDCTDATFDSADLVGVRFEWGVNLASASLRRANLINSSFDYTFLDHADFDEARAGGTLWREVDLSGARNLETVHHSGPSSLTFDTILQSKGAIPDGFLRGCGLPDPVMAYVRSLSSSHNPIQLYSCFISYSSKDQEFCERLHNDLQGDGVRCWFAPEDLKIGDRFRDEIENAIRLHDKLLLVLSDNSVQSDWVRSEVEGAFERETRERKQVLFPVRLDDAVLDTPKAWAADIRRQRHIGDFSNWKDHDAYQKAFQRLLRDLRVATPA